jgi:hypothetical protein
VLALGRPAEVQLLRQRDEVAQLPKLHARRHVRIWSISVLPELPAGSRDIDAPRQETLTASLLLWPGPGEWPQGSPSSPASPTEPAPASTGTASIPEPMKPRANSVEASEPAVGRRAPAA